jgi:nitrous oxide reductase accessory protein NosL
MKRIIGILPICALSAALLLLVSAAAPAGEKKPVAVKKGDKCRVCGMFVSGYPTWVAEIIFQDGTYAVFDGPKDMFRYYFNVPKYNPGKKQSDIDAIYVTEYYSAKFMDARKGIFFVQGSDVNGPMGPEMVPVDSLDGAKGFMKDHRGKKIFTFDEVRSEDLR